MQNGKMKFSNGILTLLLLGCIEITSASFQSCYSCSGINCLRPSKHVIIKCADDTDNCVTIFDGSQVVLRGCYSEINSNYREKCSHPISPDCNKCSGELCNNIGKPDHKCIQCDSRNDIHCKEDVSKLKSEQCPISTSINAYCYAKVIEKGHVVRGCSSTVLSQNECLLDKNCFLCLSRDLPDCNKFKILQKDDDNDGGSAASISITTMLFVSTILIQILK